MDIPVHFTWGLPRSGSAPLATDRVILDADRAWCAMMAALAELCPQARVVACVRDLRWIMESIERPARKNSVDLSGLFGFQTSATVFIRVNRLAASDRLAGFALDALREACLGQNADRVVVVGYEALTDDPERMMRALQDHPGGPWFDHDFDNVANEARDFDMTPATPDLHMVRRKVI